MPDNAKTIVCRHWLLKKCLKGNKCTYKHEYDPDNIPDCENGYNCKRYNCPLNHPSKDVNLFVVFKLVEGVFVLQAGILSSWEKVQEQVLFYLIKFILDISVIVMASSLFSSIFPLKTQRIK